MNIFKIPRKLNIFLHLLGMVLAWITGAICYGLGHASGGTFYVTISFAFLALLVFRLMRKAI